MRTHFKPCTETFQCHTPTAVTQHAFNKGFGKGEALRLPRKNSSKAMFEGNVRKFKTRLISRRCPKQKVGRNSQTKIGNAQKDSTLCHTISTVIIPNLKNILMDKWHFIQNQPLPREIFREPPLISYRKGKSLKDMLVKAEL